MRGCCFHLSSRMESCTNKISCEKCIASHCNTGILRKAVRFCDLQRLAYILKDGYLLKLWVVGGDTFWPGYSSPRADRVEIYNNSDQHNLRLVHATHQPHRVWYATLYVCRPNQHIWSFQQRWQPLPQGMLGKKYSSPQLKKSCLHRQEENQFMPETAVDRNYTNESWTWMQIHHWEKWCNIQTFMPSKTYKELFVRTWQISKLAKWKTWFKSARKVVKVLLFIIIPSIYVAILFTQGMVGKYDYIIHMYQMIPLTIQAIKPS